MSGWKEGSHVPKKKQDWQKFVQKEKYVLDFFYLMG
jgi:hypothetical protein